MTALTETVVEEVADELVVEIVDEQPAELADRASRGDALAVQRVGPA